MVKKIISYILLLLLVPAVVIAGAVLFESKLYSWISLCIALIACVPFFMTFERRDAGAKKLVLIAVMVALSVLGRIIFTPVPGFKPVTAMVIVCAVYFGSEAGFLTGALTAVISNFYFGQGPWTPFQMFVWGLLGFVAGLLCVQLKKHISLLLVYGAAAGFAFSLLMDVWSVLWMDNSFNLSRYLAAVASSFMFSLIYAISNVIFLLILSKPVGKKLDRIKIKYGIT